MNQVNDILKDYGIEVMCQQCSKTKISDYQTPKKDTKSNFLFQNGSLNQYDISFSPLDYFRSSQAIELPLQNGLTFTPTSEQKLKQETQVNFNIENMFNKTPQKLENSPLDFLRTPIQIKKKLQFTPVGKSSFDKSTSFKQVNFPQLKEKQINKENLSSHLDNQWNQKQINDELSLPRKKFQNYILGSKNFNQIIMSQDSFPKDSNQELEDIMKESSESQTQQQNSLNHLNENDSFRKMQEILYNMKDSIDGQIIEVQNQIEILDKDSKNYQLLECTKVIQSFCLDLKKDLIQCSKMMDETTNFFQINLIEEYQQKNYKKDYLELVTENQRLRNSLDLMKYEQSLQKQNYLNNLSQIKDYKESKEEKKRFSLRFREVFNMFAKVMNPKMVFNEKDLIQNCDSFQDFYLRLQDLVNQFNQKINSSIRNHAPGSKLEQIIPIWENEVRNPSIKYLKIYDAQFDELFFNNEEIKTLMETHQDFISNMNKQTMNMFQQNEYKMENYSQFRKDILKSNLFTFSEGKNQLIEFYKCIHQIQNRFCSFLQTQQNVPIEERILSHQLEQFKNHSKVLSIILEKNLQEQFQNETYNDVDQKDIYNILYLKEKKVLQEKLTKTEINLEKISNKLKEKKIDYQNELSQLKTQNQDLIQKVNSLQQKYEQTHDNLQQTQQELDHLQKSNAQFQSAISNQQNLINKQKDLNQTIYEIINSENEKLVQLKEKDKLIQNLKMDLSNAKENYEKQIEEFQQEHNILQQNISILKQQRKTVDVSQIQSINDDSIITEKYQEREEQQFYQMKVKQLENKIERLQQQLKRYEQESFQYGQNRLEMEKKMKSQIDVINYGHFKEINQLKSQLKIQQQVLMENSKKISKEKVKQSFLVFFLCLILGFQLVNIMRQLIQETSLIKLIFLIYQIFFVSQSNPSLKPVFFVTEHMNSSTGLLFNTSTFQLEKVVLATNPKTSLNSSSLTASFLSILFPKMTIGTFPISSLLTILSNSYFDSQNLLGSAASTRNTIASILMKYSLHIFLIAQCPPKSKALIFTLLIVKLSE